MADYVQQRPGQIGAKVLTRKDISGNQFGNRAGRLAESLGVLMQSATQVAEIEGKKAWEEGMKARLTDVRRENANEANKGLFAPLFRSRAIDGFDYQDAKFDASTIAMEEQISMYEALKDSTRPEDFEAWAKSRDEALTGRLEGKSDIYKTALAEDMVQHRDSQVRTFGNWIIQNRERAAREAAAAAAKAETERQKMRLEAAGSAAFEDLFDGTPDVNQALTAFVNEAPEKFGITRGEAREIFFTELANKANIDGDYTILETVDPRLLTTEQREDWGKARKEVLDRQKAVESYEREKAEALVAAQREAEEKEANAAVSNALRTTLRDGRVSPDSIAAMAELPYFQNNPTKLSETVSSINSTAGQMVDPAVERLTLTQLQEEAIEIAAAGGDPTSALMYSLDSIRSPEGRKKAAEIVEGAAKAHEDRVFEYASMRERDFKTLFANDAPKDTAASQLGLTSPDPAVVGFVTQAMQDYNEALIDYHRDWYLDPANEGRRLTRTERIAMERQAFEEVRTKYEAQAASLKSQQELANQGSAVDALNSIIKK